MRKKTVILVCSLIIGLTALPLAHAQTNTPSSATPAISVTPGSLDFGTVGVGRTNELSLRVRNVGGGMLIGTAIAAPPFSLTAGAGYSLANGQSQSVKLRYSPTTAGTNSQTVRFTGGGDTTIPVSGQASARPAPPMNLRISAAP